METKYSPLSAKDGAARLHAWVLSDADSQADTYRAACWFLHGIRERSGSAGFLVDEVAPMAVCALAREGYADKANALLSFLSTFRPDRGATSLRFSHARQLAQLRRDLATYVTV